MSDGSGDTQQEPAGLTRRSLIGRGLAAGAGVSILHGIDVGAARASAPALAGPPVTKLTVHWDGDPPTDPIVWRNIHDPSIVYTTQDGVLVMAVRAELLVRSSAVEQLTTGLKSHQSLHNYATRISTLRESFMHGSLPGEDHAIPLPTLALHELIDDIELWQINQPHIYDSITLANYYSPLVSPAALPQIPTLGGPGHQPPAISPNHVLVACSDYNSCPGGPPRPAALISGFIPAAQSPTVRVVAIDSGYVNVKLDPEHNLLTQRVVPATGYYVKPGGSWPWAPCPVDGVLKVDLYGPNGLVTPTVAALDGVAGHGTFVAGIIASRSPHARITVVGERRVIGQLSTATFGARTIYADELSIARSLLRYSTAEVVSCGFAFPPLGQQPSIPFALVMDALAKVASLPASAQTQTVAAVVAPAGNEGTTVKYWPAAHADVIGVAATDPTQLHQAVFRLPSGVVVGASNWGSWLKCAAIGQDVVSTFLSYVGRVEEYPSVIYPFKGWAQWDGTSFAAPKVSAALAEEIAGGAAPRAAYGSMNQSLGSLGLLGTATGPSATLPALLLG